MVVVRGGEDIPNNTYGFEIEFCSHDNSVLAFTHVEVAKIVITLEGYQGEQRWHIETDSGNVLELVSPPLQFAQLDLALNFRTQLGAALSATVDAGKTLAEWSASFDQPDNPLRRIIGEYYASNYRTRVRIQLAWSDVGAVAAQLTAVNVDDGINIRAAQLRLERNRHRWFDYLGETIVSRSEKDWERGYGSQVNMPMTLLGYFEYVLRTKYTKGWTRMNRIYGKDGELASESTAKLERWITTWFWENVITAAFLAYVNKLPDGLALAAGMFDAWGIGRGAIKALLDELVRAVDPQEDIPGDRALFVATANLLQTFLAVEAKLPSAAQVQYFATRYVQVHKVLTGALGALSEEKQLALQIAAFAEGSTQSIELTGTESAAEEASRRWLEYHSALKDLTGLWFKGAFHQVLKAETAEPVKLVTNEYTGALIFFVALMRADFWDNERVIVDDLAFLRIDELSASVTRVIATMDTLDLREFENVLPNRKFLDYAAAPAWEGRYDTMWNPIEKFGVGTTYLVEHRNN